MREIDDGKAYTKPVRRRGWYNQYGFAKRNKRRDLSERLPPKRIPPKTGKKRAGYQMRFKGMRDHTGVFTNFIDETNVD